MGSIPIPDTILEQNAVEVSAGWCKYLCRTTKGFMRIVYKELIVTKCLRGKWPAIFSSVYVEFNSKPLVINASPLSM